MKLSEYFEKTEGRGVLATADSKGFVDVAVYSRPHFIDEETIAYIMTGKLTHENLKTNPHAAYLFMEKGEKFAGKRLYLTKIKEDTDPEAIEKIRWRKSYKVPDDQKDEKRYLVFFHIDKVLPLIGDKE
ncbi:MAG TPA: pyridoxamine 5'-phosphate oxidase family protein [Syntrophorhabdaceae bacterium]|nr:pyridoxamine 5'-phosphate oxidase family protein [Syntrophorhabdaceae bacterium]HOL05371.1 pyridoxamine 5'-phosphate oxidase family protein [Syntrophorhabdaceae bacterium]HON85030.1 pyridoxamine 5'-phosphate oxidase family protein [Syntrophorhabdaceae bacterium]HOT41551.1 pyridoxamine 5'-phosphate oxidase family protein [Syntrophorhabdaceae bacterium]HPC65849.1 pyridoxamine 5'-phosphate oxidase family protein [Syntrophorhabdaceae bacterium]